MLRARYAEAPPIGAGAGIMSRGSIDALRIHGVRIDVRGPRPSTPSLLAANHVSYLDPIAVMAIHPCLPAAKKQVADWPVFGSLARAGGIHFIDRGNRADGARVVRAFTATLEAGTSALNFPEGTTSDGEKTLPFRPGGFAAARIAGAPVVPVALRYEPRSLAWTGSATFVPHYLTFCAERTSTVRVRFGEPIRQGKSDAETAAECRAVVDRMLAEMG
jgi:1-acyl-sn-glycerol-3-phosphate acyltransferase